MKIKQLFFKPLDRSINGVVKADQDDEVTVFQELDEYVVTNELEKHFRAFFDAYSTALSDPSISNRVGVWISGFFGSGKSHFLKILSYILANRPSINHTGQSKPAVEYFDQHKIHDAMIRADIDKAVSTSADVILFNIDSKASVSDGGNKVLDVFLRVFNEHQGYSGDDPHVAHMERHLAQKGKYQAFKEAYKDASGSEWCDERDAYALNQDEVERALSAALGLSAEAANKWFEESEQKFAVSVEKFCGWVKEYLDTQPADHRLLFLVDEVGQFIGSDTKLMLTLQTITENLGTVCKGRAWIIVTSQADMDAVLGELTSTKANDFSKIAGRFKTRLSLSSSNTDEVIQRRLLSKTPEAEAELRAVYAEKGDILKNQLTFDRSGPTLKNIDGPDSFVANYPFAPFHFQLVQKVFEEIRKVGASGAHLAYGERSMLDAFQMAALSIGQQNIGALIPMHAFYASVEGFLDTAVKNTIDQASQDPTLNAVDVELLRTLFMIRYVDLIKGTLDNLVTLSIEQIDQDKLSLRKQIDESIQRLERQSLITRNGDEFLFLTNEERDITRKIKNIDIAANEENKELSNLIFKDLLKDKNKYRYPINKMDYSIGRYVDGHTLDGRHECDLRIDIVSPLDIDYSQYSEAGCINKSTEGNGVGLIKLADHPTFFTELRTWLKTNKYIRLNDDASQSDITRILADRGRENQERKRRLRSELEGMLLAAQIYGLGQRLTLSSSSLTTLIDGTCEYLLKNTFTKLDYLRVLQDDPYRELAAILSVDDIGQIGLGLDGEAGNSQAINEVEQHISLRASGSERILVSDIIERFSQRPYGWPDAEILLILARLAAAGRISFQLSGGTLALTEAQEPLQNSRRRRDVSVIKRRQTDDALLKQAQQLSRDLFSAIGPSSEKELFAFYRQHIDQWLSNLHSYKSKADISRVPGEKSIKTAIQQLESLTSYKESFDFFTYLLDHKSDYLDLEEDYRDLHEFFTNQLQTWQQLQQALSKFDSNTHELEKDAGAAQALTELRSIETSESPFAQLHKVAQLISAVDRVNSEIVTTRYSQAVTAIDEKIKQLEGEITKSGVATPELSNQLLRPLQLLKQKLQDETNIAAIYMAQSETASEVLEEGLAQLEQAIRREAGWEQESGDDSVVGVQDRPVVTVPKAVTEIRVSAVFNRVSSGVYMETQEDVSSFIEALTDELEAAIKQEKRVRIR
jgi:hypothetical protein